MTTGYHEEITAEELVGYELKYLQREAEDHAMSNVACDVRRLVIEIRWLREMCEEMSGKTMAEIMERLKILRILKATKDENAKMLKELKHAKLGLGPRKVAGGPVVQEGDKGTPPAPFGPDECRGR